MKLIVDKEVLDLIVNYLAQKPYAEVAPLLDKLTKNLKELKQEPEAASQK